MAKKISIIGIIPQYPSHSQSNIYARVRMPPVGIISVLTQIRHYKEFSTYAIDENNYGGPKDFTGYPDHSFLQENEPAKLALFYGGMSNSVPRLLSLAKLYKNWGAITIAGGSHVDALPEETLNSGVDIVVHGEGEYTFKQLIGAILDSEGNVKNNYQENLNEIKGISFLDKKGKHIFTGKREPIKDLNILKDPDLTLIKHLHKKWTSIPINKGRGCNFRCEFCVVNQQYGNYKTSSVEKALRQVIRYSDMGYKSFFFTDDNFAQNIPEAIELCQKIGDYKRKFGKKIKLITQVRTEVAENDELIEAMKYAGVKTCCIGFESPIDAELKAMNKAVTVKLLTRRARKLAKSFYLHGMFIFGYPKFGDSSTNLSLNERARHYLRFFRKAKIDTVQVLNAVPLPGSLLRKKLEDAGRLFPLEMVGWDKYDGLFLCYDPSVEGLDAYELQMFPKILMKKKYLGNFVSRSLNYGNWMNWLTLSVGFPLHFSVFYVKNFVRNMVNLRREKKVLEFRLPSRSILKDALTVSWGEIAKYWRNLAVKTYAGGIVKKWYKEYKKTKHTSKLSKLSNNINLQ